MAHVQSVMILIHAHAQALAGVHVGTLAYLAAPLAEYAILQRISQENLPSPQLQVIILLLRLEVAAAVAVI